MALPLAVGQLPGAASTETITVKITAARNGQAYRCVVTRGNDTVTSDEAALYIGE